MQFSQFCSFFLFQNFFTRGYEKYPLNYIPVHIVLPVKFEPQMKLDIGIVEIKNSFHLRVW